MKVDPFLWGILILIIFSSGCTGPISPVSTGTTTTPDPTPPIPQATAPPDVSVPFTTGSPLMVMMTLGPLKTVRDPELWFSLQVPDAWVVTTERISNPEGYEGLVYVTHLYNKEDFFIITYAISRGQDQAFRNYYRDSWSPQPVESTVTRNGIVFDRFESASENLTRVAHVARKGSANERGYASVIEYSLYPDHGYQQNDLESVISTFRYIGSKDIQSAKGEEIVQ